MTKLLNKIIKHYSRPSLDFNINPIFATESFSLNPNSKKFYDHNSPFSYKYFSSFKTFFFNELITIDQLNVKPYWLVRDGTFYLREYLNMYSDLGKLKSKIYIEENCGVILPDHWRGSVGSYRIFRKREWAREQLVCIINPFFDLNSQIRFYKKKHLKKKIIFLAFRDQHKILNSIYDKNLTYQDLHYAGSLKNYVFDDEFSKYFIADSFLGHLISSKEGLYLPYAYVKETAKLDEIPLSPFHFVVLNAAYRPLAFKKDLALKVVEEFNIIQWKNFYE